MTAPEGVSNGNWVYEVEWLPAVLTLSRDRVSEYDYSLVNNRFLQALHLRCLGR